MAGFLSTAANAYVIYGVLRRLTKKFSNWEAFKTGVIDENGNILVEPKDRTQQQKDSFSLLDVMVLNMKKLLAKIPGGSSAFASYAAALFLLKEQEISEANFTKFLKEQDENEILKLMEEHGAGFEGTDQLVDKYTRETPHQKRVIYGRRKDGSKRSKS